MNLTPDDLLDHFGTQVAIARALGISEGAVSRWFTLGVVPMLRQYQLAEMIAAASSQPRATMTRSPQDSR